MRVTSLWRKPLSILSVVLVQFLSAAPPAAQTLKPTAKAGPKAVEAPAPVDRQVALWLLERLANDLRAEPNKPAAAALQAHAADVLWKFDEGRARAIFRVAFDSARQPPPDDLKGAERSRYSSRQAATLKEVLRLYGAHDRDEANAWLKAVEEENASADSAHKMQTPEQRQLLSQLAYDLVADNPEQAQQLGRLSLSGTEIPDDFGRLLFALSNNNRDASDALFREAVAALQRGGYPYSNALIVLSNYLFDARGIAHSDASPADVQLLISLFLNSAAAHANLWREASAAGAAGVPEGSANLYSFLASRAAPIVARYAPGKMPELSAQMNQLLSGLNQQQARHAEMLTSAQQQQIAVSDRNSYDIDEQVERADQEKDKQVRDLLLRSAALSLMRADGERALTVAAKIGDAGLRAQTEDDINIVQVQEFLRWRFYDDGRRVALKLNNVLLGARMLAALASSALSEKNDSKRATELLSEASSIAQKSEDTPGKLLALLAISQQFAKFDLDLGFQTLTVAVKTANRLKDEAPPAASATAAPLLTFKSYSVINGVEMTTSEHITVDSIDFSQVGALAAKDYTRTRVIGDMLEDKLLNAKFLIAAARSVLAPPRQEPNAGAAPGRIVIRKTSGTASQAPR